MQNIIEMLTKVNDVTTMLFNWNKRQETKHRIVSNSRLVDFRHIHSMLILWLSCWIWLNLTCSRRTKPNRLEKCSIDMTFENRRSHRLDVNRAFDKHKTRRTRQGQSRLVCYANDSILFFERCSSSTSWCSRHNIDLSHFFSLTRQENNHVHRTSSHILFTRSKFN
jgi:hypothetical protein